MRISLVITGINHENTIMEATESVLSQLRLPDEFGMVVGPSYDRSREFVEFYRDELDFAYFPESVDTAMYGHGKLRLEVINRLEGDYVLFLPAHSVLYPDAIQTLEEGVADQEHSPDIVFASFRILRQGETEPREWSISSRGYRSLLSGGPIHSGMVLYRIENLRTKMESLERLRAGPFTTLGWILECLRDTDARAQFLNDVIGELWDEVEASYCWTNSTQRGIREIRRMLEGMIPESTAMIESWESRGPVLTLAQNQTKTCHPGSDHKDVSADETACSWIDADIPFVE